MGIRGFFKQGLGGLHRGGGDRRWLRAHLGIETRRHVVAWGRNDFGQADVPAGLANVTAIAAGSFHNLALRGDGSVVAWGNALSGDDLASALAGHEVIALAAGLGYDLAVVRPRSPSRR
jgi:hypothetical protein